ncbi:Hypothetical_protein [Hexamita inflata]|uniref:Hypothetical_protein n=1 Tax=Hexamita inflata TaxID=28002 RepID=A0AA86NWH7_9EUKA|nr:Hypothetical protein HINF_LOCUS14779 [Hexamita inflata]
MQSWLIHSTTLVLYLFNINSPYIISQLRNFINISISLNSKQAGLPYKQFSTNPFTQNSFTNLTAKMKLSPNRPAATTLKTIFFCSTFSFSLRIWSILDCLASINLFCCSTNSSFMRWQSRRYCNSVLMSLVFSLVDLFIKDIIRLFFNLTTKNLISKTITELEDSVLLGVLALCWVFTEFK